MIRPSLQLVAFIIAGVLFLDTGVSSFGAAVSRVRLSGHVPSAIAKLPSTGSLPSTNRIQLAIGLPLRNQAELEQTLGQLYDPKNPRFHKFLSTEEFTAHYGPTLADYQALMLFARKQGLSVVRQHSNRVVLEVEGSVASIEQAFQINLKTYRHPREARVFFSADSEPSVPTNLPVADMWGLSDYARPTPLARRIDPINIAPQNYNGTGPGGTYQGRDFRNAYARGTSLVGTGQIAAVTEFDGYYTNDIATYEANCGYAHVPVTNILLGVTGIPGFSGLAGANIEVSLDIELTIAMAPGLSALLVYEGSSPYTVFNRIATDNLAKQISCSWAWYTGPTHRWGHNSTTTLDFILSQMAAQGQSFFAASGDSDAYTGSQAVNATSGPIPCDSIYVTSVGGTSLTMSGVINWSSESVWNWGGNVGSGGGISTNYALPFWQTNVSMAANGGSSVYRNFPDVAMTADAVRVIYGNGSSGQVGGTSCAAPLWAGFAALVNQQALASGNSTVGFLNPALYNIAAGTNYTACFHDITTGNNIGTNTAGLFYAVAGYDLATGLGTPNGVSLINALAPSLLPYLASQPVGLALTNGANAVFSASAAGPGTLSYLWLFNGTNLAAVGNASGTASNTLTMTSVTIANAGNYSLVVTNAYGAATSSVATLTVLLPASISVSPAAQTIQCGSNVVFTVTADGTVPLRYQWSLDGSAITGATNTSLLLTNVHLPSHTISVVVTNLYGSASSSAALTVQDTQAPVIALYGANPLYVELGGNYTEPGATANDLCAGPVSVTNDGEINANVAGTNTVTYTATDGNGNSNSLTRTVIVRDLTGPTVLWSFTNLVMAADLNCVAVMPGVTTTNFVIDADLSGVASITQIPTNNTVLSIGTNVVILTVADGAGNTTYSTNRIVVSDQTPPNIALNGLSSMRNELGVAFVDPGVTASDSCSGIDSVVTNGMVHVQVGGTNLVTYIATDISGNSNSITRSVTVSDTTAPVILRSFTNLVVAANSNCEAVMPGVTGTDFVLATDASGALTITQSPTNNAVLLLGTNVVVMSVVDASGNAAYSTNQIVVRDQTPPAIALNGSSPMQSELGNAFTDPGVTASDGCSGLASLVTNGAVNIGVVGTNLVTYTAVDASGNSNSITRTVVVRDTTAPTILWSFTNLVFAANSNCEASMPSVMGTNYILATDLSGVATITQSPANNAILSLGTNIIILAVADASGNKAHSTNQIVVRDQTPPSIVQIGSSPVQIELGGAFVDPGVTASDTCSGIDFLNTNGSVNVNVLGTNLLTYTATDRSGNSNSTTRTIVVKDTVAPTILWGFTNLELIANLNCEAAMPDVTGTNYFLVTDSSGALTMTQSPTNNAVLALGTNVVILTVADGSGNRAYSTNQIVVIDRTPPVMTLNGPSSMQNEFAFAFADPGVIASDTCSGIASLITNGSVNIGVVGTNFLTYVAIDGSGNTNSLTRTVIVRDTVVPTILWSFTNLVLAANSNCEAVMPDVTGTNYVLPLDSSGAVVINQSPTNNAVLALGTNVVLLTVVDASGNVAYSTNQIVALDQTPPGLLLNGPSPLLNELGAAFIDPGVTASDDCSGVAAIVTNGTVNVGQVGINLLNYIAVDGSGNTNSLMRSVIISDTTAPTIVWSFTNLVVAVNAGGLAYMPEVTGTSYLLATDVSEMLAITQNPTNNAGLSIGTNLVILTVSDASGNTAYSTNQIVVIDQTPPEIALIGPSPMQHELGVAFEDPGVTASDDTATTLFTNGTVNVAIIGANLLTYTAVDSSGNTNSITRTVVVQDTIAPAVLWGFTNLVLAADLNCGAAMPNVTGTYYFRAADASGALTIAQNPTNGAVLLLGTNVVVISVADPSGNLAYSTNLIVVEDQTPPLILVQPTHLTNNAGGSASFSVLASACTPLSFQWFFYEAALVTETNSTLTISNLTPTLAGDYSVIVSSGGGATRSDVVSLACIVVIRTNSIPVITYAPLRPDGGLDLILSGDYGSAYIMESTTNLTSNVWNPVVTNTPALSGLWQFAVDPSANFQRFYRVKLVQ